jgi:hypothetical protein
MTLSMEGGAVASSGVTGDAVGTVGDPVPRPPKSRIDHATFHYHDADLATTRVRGIGFRAVCACGEHSRVVASYAMARGWNRDHARTHLKGGTG